MKFKILIISCLIVILKISGRCNDSSQSNISAGWINRGRQLIQCLENGFTTPETFHQDFKIIIQDIKNPSDNMKSTPSPSAEILNDARSLFEGNKSVADIQESKLYNFLKNPYYNILLNKYGIADESMQNDDFKTKLTWLCTKTADLPIVVFTDKSIGWPINFKFGDASSNDSDQNNICGLNSALYPALVGWAERNIAPNPNEFIGNPVSVMFQNGAKKIKDPPKDNSRSLTSYLVGDPNCPQLEDSHFYGCRICDQFLYNGRSTAAYKFCQFGYNWTHPLIWQGNGCTSVNRKNICVEGSNLLYYLYTWVEMWWNQGAWGYLDFNSNQYAPIPSTMYDLYWQWGKNGINSGSDDAYSYSTANIADCMSAGRNNICDDENNKNPGTVCSCCEGAEAYSGYSCIRWNKPGFKPCIPCYSIDNMTLDQWRNKLNLPGWPKSNEDHGWCHLNQGSIGNFAPLAQDLDATWKQDICTTTLLDPVSDSVISDCHFWDGTNASKANENPKCKGVG
jgi:hypothetical protein